ncbi:hypothetical protein EK21DRAFT_98519 [Setomelanomma holmii]|uniref:Uncharacterized protein n=1 Tax=Setomelanomma holmii TaxID=210430 RepID=A0A9P4HF64_9PLEO|nr:hypothetical protein EK21DRAFT_98519 [Setomelanomma holmii]
MATYDPYSRSPQLPAHEIAPITPVHSPHHSVTSSVSNRTPIHPLSIHEYRRQQNTPGLQTATPPGKTLRRKPAAPALNGIERAPSVVRTSHMSVRSAPRPLVPSQSAYQLSSHQQPFQPQSLSDQILRSQSAEPRTQGGSISSISTTTSTGKIRHFNSRKRLPKPPGVTDFLPLPSNLATVKTNTSHRSPPPHALDVSTESSHSSAARTTNTASTFSLSRFPQPPHFQDASISPPHNENDQSRINTRSFASTAPATPPATPATIHYRGASFDLVNPHESLLLHDIVTPSKDFGSSEYLLARPTEELSVASAEMAPKRALYGDLSAAHAGIMRRADDSFGSSNLDLPLPPTPAAVSPGSSTYTSPVYSPESNLAPPPLAVQKAPSDSRFSLKQLTRTLTRRLGKEPERPHGEELQDLHDADAQRALADDDGIITRGREAPYVSTPQSAYFPVNPTSPVTPTSPVSPQEHASEEEEYGDEDIELPRKHPMQRYDTSPLTSLLPEDPSTQVGRVDNRHMSMSGGYLDSRPYYDDLDSIYPSSSIYTSDDRRRSNYQQSLTNTRQSNPFLRYSGMDASSFANEYNQDSLYAYSSHSQRKSKPLPDHMYQRTTGQDKTDTISRIIDQYDPSRIVDSTMTESSGDRPHTDAFAGDASAKGVTDLYGNGQEPTLSSDLSQFQFGLHGDTNRAPEDELSLNRRPTLRGGAGLPPDAPAPLAPAFQFRNTTFALPHLERSEMFSNRSSSYGDTRNLLQIPHGEISAPLMLGQSLQPSSSYSQPDAKPIEQSSSYPQAANSPSPQTPQEALDEAEQIFQSATGEQQREEKSIPAIWARRSSGSLLLSKKATDSAITEPQSLGDPELSRVGGAEGNEADWESVGAHSRDLRNSLNSHEARDSFDSVADYSSSEGTRNSLGMNSNGSLPSDVDPPYALAPWADPYAFSDKETQELLASGPNDKIIFDGKRQSALQSDEMAYQSSNNGGLPVSSSPPSIFDDSSALQRENTFEKLSVVGPRGNLTGTPRGTGMHETGSSIADNSSPVITLFPRPSELEPVIKTSPGDDTTRRPSLRLSTTFNRPQRRMSRTAVHGQTKLRQMILSPESARKTLSSADTNFSRFMGGSERPSTSDTVTPLHPHLSVDTAPMARALIAHQHSPHLLCPERAANPEDEERRRRLSWAILAVFCLLPPCIILFRVWGDTLMISLTEGRLGHCTNRSKKVALVAGIGVNIGIAVAIVVPIVIAHALGAA